MNVYPHIAERLKATMGLDVATVGENSLHHAVRERMAACDLESEAQYWERLQDSREEWQELIEAVVVPETWFFRDSGAFAALISIVFQEWLPANPSGVLRILSVPCSTGEEPSSIAMALLDAGLPAKRFTIDGVDISARSLAIAERGVYGKNSFRGSDLEFRDRYFQLRQSRHVLSPQVRECVRYRRGNLLAESFLAGAEPYDFVFCRNVLIYFDADTQQQVIRTLERLLTKEGTLFVGPAEPFLLRQKGLASTKHPHAFAYRKSAPPARSSPVAESLRARERARRSPVPKRVKPVKPSPGRKREIPASQPPPVEKPDELEVATRLADAGKLGEAERACEAHLRERGPTAAGYYLLGLVRDAMGLEQQAGDCYRKTIYLDPDHLDALMHLALLAQKRGDVAVAHRLQNRAQRIQEGAES